MAKLEVVKATLRVGRPKLNRKRGLPVTVPGGGILTLKGRGVRASARAPDGIGVMVDDFFAPEIGDTVLDRRESRD